MVSNVEKGRRLEKKARERLISEGYKIFFKSMRMRFGCQDFANLFDIVAAKVGVRLYVSVKTFVSASRHAEHIREVEKFIDLYGLHGEVYAIWFWKDREWYVRRWEVLSNDN